MKNYRKEAIEIATAIYGQNSKFANAVINFAIDGYESAMTRKTWTETDEKMLNLLEEMVKEIKEKREEKTEKAIYTVLIDGLYVTDEYIGESYKEALEVFNSVKGNKAYGIAYLYKQETPESYAVELMHG